MADLDPDFAALAQPAPVAATASSAQSGLDPEFAALAPGAQAAPHPAAVLPSGWQFMKSALGSYASHPLTTGVGMLENALSGVTGGAGALADAVTGSDPGTYDLAYRPHTEAGKQQAQLNAIAAQKIGQQLPDTPLANTLKERIPEALGAVGTLAMLPELPKGAAAAVGMARTPFPKAIPNPQAAARAAILKAGQDQGYVVPPSTGNPTLLNKFMGGVAGKVKVQQAAQAINRDVTARSAATSLGQGEDFVPTPENLARVRADAFQRGYVPVRSVGQMTGDDQLTNALDAITSQSKGASRSFPAAFPQNSELNTTLEGLKQNTFDSGDAIDAIAELRNRSSDAYGAQQNSLGKSYKGAAKALEDAVERNLAAQGKSGAQMLQDYRDARATIAKTHSVQKALTGDEVDAVKLGTQLQSGKPLSGPLKTTAQMASVRAFRPSMSLPSGANEGVSPLDVYGTLAAAGATHSLRPVAIPFTRAALARYLLSPAGQARAIPKAFRPKAEPPVTGLLNYAGQASPAIQSLLNMPSQTP